MVLLEILAAILAVCALIYYYFIEKFKYWGNIGVPHQPPTFPIGSMKGVGKEIHMFEMMEANYKLFKSRAKYFGMYFFTRPVAVITDLELVKSILVKDSHNFINKGMFYNEVDDPLSAHLFAIDNPKWKALRSKLTPTFTSGKMKMMFGTIVDVAHKFIETMEKESTNQKEYQVKDILSRFTTDVIGSCAFGLNISSLDDPNVQFRILGKKMFDDPFTMRLLFMVTFQDLARKLHMSFIPKDISDFFMNIVKETVDYREKQNVVRPDFMNLLIQLKNKGELEGENESEKKEHVGKLTIEEIAAQAFVFFLAGFETSSTAMTFLLHELALNHEIQEKARQNVLQVLKKHDEKLTYEAVMEMTYLDQCIYESLRKYPPVTDLSRTAAKDYKVEGTDLVIKAATQVVVPVYAIQHDPEFYPDPETFDPERFTSDEINNRNNYTFLAFGEGPRACIGLRFGMLQAKIGMALMLTNFKFDKCDKTTIPIKFLKHTFTLTPNDGVFLNVTKIEK